MVDEQKVEIPLEREGIRGREASEEEAKGFEDSFLSFFFPGPQLRLGLFTQRRR